MALFTYYSFKVVRASAISRSCAAISNLETQKQARRA